MQRLIINADDFGYSKEVNEGILEGHEVGTITSTSIMTNQKWFDHAVSLYPRSLGIGVHLNITWGSSLTTGAPFSTWNKHKAVIGVINKTFVENEFRRQIELLFEVGITPDHLDTHHHLHAFPPITSIVVNLAKEFHIHKIRWPRERGNDIALRMSYLKQKLIAARLRPCPLKTTDRFFGIRYAGEPTVEKFLSYLDFEGYAEICCHPGKKSMPGEDLLYKTRDKELEILTSQRFLDEIQKRNIQLISFREL